MDVLIIILSDSLIELILFFVLFLIHFYNIHRAQGTHTVEQPPPRDRADRPYKVCQGLSSKAVSRGAILRLSIGKFILLMFCYLM
jgi:hypothetical protein